MRILIAPNSFKECASSIDLAALISDELLKNNISDVTIFPVSDGGDDFLEVYKLNFPCDSLKFKIRKCYNTALIHIPAAYDINLSSFILESACIIGLRNIPSAYRDPLRLNSENLGLLLSDLIRDHGAKRITIGLGGTGTTDLGLGLCLPFGLKLFDKRGKELEIIPENYNSVNKVILPQKSNIEIEAVADVIVPLYGRSGAAYKFAAQKGASEEDISVIDKGFRNIIYILERDHRLNFKNTKIGAAGGLALGLSLMSNLKLTSSKEFLKRRLNIHTRIKASDLIITGEGRFDEQSLLKKASGVIVSEALKRNKKVVIIAGECLVDFNKYKHPPIIFELIKLLGSKEKAIVEYRRGIALSIIKLADFIHQS